MINEAYYKGQDLYTDGDIEEEILSLVRTRDDFTEILAEETRWPMLYHLSPERWNLLDWYPFDKGDTLLEIGAGCGALTGLFCEKLRKVTAVELSRKRSEIIEQRYRDSRNLEILVGNFDEMAFNESFDYVTLIGVLEYAKNFIRADQPYHHLLNKAGNLLNPNGRLLLAIENKYGLKYWAGSREDHTAGFFDGIEDYIHRQGIQETFGKMEIIDLLKQSGFKSLQFYYPHPDYKMPLEIFSDHCLPNTFQVLTESPNYDKERMSLFSETLAFTGLIRNGMYDFFANSFLIIASKEETIATHLHQI
ncbi:MAG: class I SAM-dependent methyltransferase [Desulfobacterales bacterium]|jgi:cyclopropane fatty-acyl-phospholipid synthase-like methyltransferase|nr:class I SAM-dependent methyltransferase [Desulfobacterales bacterium]